jgi:hypothetical protein
MNAMLAIATQVYSVAMTAKNFAARSHFKLELEVNIPFALKDFGQVSNLRGWSSHCINAPASRLPRLILDVCQALYDTMPREESVVSKKRSVFERVSKGSYIEAISVMMPNDVDISLSEAPTARERARLRCNKSGFDLTCDGDNQGLALLGCLIEYYLCACHER